MLHIHGFSFICLYTIYNCFCNKPKWSFPNPNIAVLIFPYNSLRKCQTKYILINFNTYQHSKQYFVKFSGTGKTTILIRINLLDGKAVNAQNINKHEPELVKASPATVNENLLQTNLNESKAANKCVQMPYIEFVSPPSTVKDPECGSTHSELQILSSHAVWPTCIYILYSEAFECESSFFFGVLIWSTLVHIHKDPLRCRDTHWLSLIQKVWFI